MSITAETKIAIEIHSNKGINGSVAISSLPDGNCIEAENVSLSTSGIIQKRPGYNIWGCELPLKLKSLDTNGEARFETVPILSVAMKLHVFTNINSKFPSLGYYSTLQNNEKSSVLCELNYNTTYEDMTPEEIVITVDSIFELADGSCVSPLHIFNKNLFSLPLSAVTVAATGITYADLLIAGSHIVAAAYQPILSQGVSLFSLGEEDISDVLVANAREVSLVVKAPILEMTPGTPVFFECGIYGVGQISLQGRVDVNYLNSIRVLIENADIDLAEYPVNAAIDVNYLRVRYFLPHALQSLSAGSFWRTAYSSSATANKTSVYSVNSLQHIDLANDKVKGSLYLYGVGISSGRVNLLNSLFHTYEGTTNLVCGCSGNIFKEVQRNSLLNTIQGLPINVSLPTVVKKTASGRITIPVTNAHTLYRPTDVAVLTYVVDNFGGVDTKEFLVIGVSATGVVVDSQGIDSAVLYPGSVLDFKRTTDKIYLTLGQMTETPCVRGCTAQYPSSDGTHPHNMVLDTFVSGTEEWIQLDEAIEWSTNSSIRMMNWFQPVDLSSTTLPLPTTSSEFPNSTDIHTTQFDSALYMACGANGIWRYDGGQLSGFNLPTPPTGHLRSIPGSLGFLDTTLAEGNKRVGKELFAFFTYSYEDDLGRVYESGVTPDMDMVIIPGAAQDESGFSEVVEIQIPSIPRDIGLPADKIKINAYRFMTTELEGTTFAPTLEVSVPNNPDLPFTIVRLGTQYIQSSSSRNKLYTYDPVGGQDSSLYRESNRTSPLAKIVSTASNRVVAMNGSEPLYFDLVGRQVYDSLLGNLFGAYLKLGYVPIDGRTRYEFYTVPFGMEGTSVIVAPSNYPGTFPTPTAYKVSAAGTFIKDVVSLSYTDNSHRFSVKLDTAIDYTSDVAGQYFKLRTISTGNLDSLSIKFNKEVFTRHAAYSTSDDKLWLTGTTRWVDDSNITSGVPEVLKNVSYACFANAFATPGDSPITSVGNTGVMFVVVAGSAIRLYIATSSPYYTLNQFQAKLLVIHGPDTLGNIRLAGQTAQLSWDKDLVFYSLNAEAVDAGVAGFVYYTLVPKKLLVDNANPGKYIAKDFSWEADAAGITADQTNYTLQVFTCIQEPAELLGTIADISIPSKDVAVTLNNATGIAPGSYVGLSLASSITLPSGWANVLQGSYKVSSVAGAVVHIEVNPAATLLETSPSVVTPPVGSTNTAMNMDGAAQLEDGVLSFGVAVTPTGIRAGDFVYCVFRDTDEASVSLQLTGWFEVDSTEAGWISVKYPLASGNYFDMGAISSVRLSYILALNNSVTGVIKVPIPVPHKLDMVDLAAPHFDQNADTRVTPLALVMRRLALGMNQVLNKVGFAYWGGAVGSIAYPSNGFRHIAHKYPVNRYPMYRADGVGWEYSRTPISRAAYDAPFDTFTLAGASGYYALNGSVNTNDVYRNEAYVSEGVTTEKTFTHREDQYPSRLWYTSPVSQNIVRAARIAAFNYKSYLDINSGDGEAITGATPYQDSLLVFKTNSIWRVTFDENGFPAFQRVQATVGSIAGKSIVAFERGVMFIHSTGIYVTDGVNIETITELSRAFGERVQQNQGLLSEGAGHVDPITKEVYLGVPYSTAENTYASQSDAAFVYNYNSVVLGWSVNTNTPAVWWTRIANKDYFCSQEGKVFRVRYETGLQKYRDFTSPVVMKLVTRYVDESQANRFKFYRNAIFQFGNDCARNMKIAYGTNYSMVPVDLPVIPVKSHRFGTEEFGRGMYGTNSWLSPTRRGLGPGRVAQLSFTIVDDTLDSSGSLYLVAVEGQVTNSKLVPQTSMVRGR